MFLLFTRIRGSRIDTSRERVCVRVFEGDLNGWEKREKKFWCFFLFIFFREYVGWEG